MRRGYSTGTECSRIGSALGRLAIWLFLLVAGAQPVAAGTRAGSFVVNRAQLLGRLDDQEQRLESNTVSDRMDELLDVSIAAASSTPLGLEAGADAQPVPFMVRNEGNGSEAFLISAGLSGAGATLRAVAMDVDDNGRFDPSIDTVIGPNDPALAFQPGMALRFFALVDTAGPGEARLIGHARSATGTGPPGTIFPGQGDSGGDALTGRTHAEASVTLDLAVAGAAVSLFKSQQVLDAAGNPMPVRGATVRYVIEARLTPGATVAGARIVDPVPAGTHYVPGSLKLDGTALTEAADGDPGVFQANSIEVALGDLAATPVRTIAFDVRID